jgi:hypothetical protein
MAVIPEDIGWNDIGSWASLFEVLPLDSSGNAFKAQQTKPDQICMDTRNTLVFSDKLVVTIGVDNLVVVETPDAILICHKDRAQEVYEVVNQLKAMDRDHYLYTKRIIMTQAYCVKCKTKREMASAHPVYTRTGTPGTQGECPVCGTTLFRMGVTDKSQFHTRRPFYRKGGHR